MLSGIVLVLVLLFCSVSYSIQRKTNSSYYDILDTDVNADLGEIKKKYRKLALLYHPDKLSLGNYSDDQLQELNDQFLDIQEAYEVLSDPEKRDAYDYELAGVHVETQTVYDYERFRYLMKPFTFFAQTRKFKLYFNTNFGPLLQPELTIIVPCSLLDNWKGKQHKAIVLRYSLCKECNGTGGLHGACRTCNLCGGTGVGTHFFSSNSRKFRHITKTTCAACRGRGCIFSEACSKCHGSGKIKDQVTMILEMPPGFNQGQEWKIVGEGSVNDQGTRQDVLFRAQITLPFPWKFEDSNPYDIFADHFIELSTLLSLCQGNHSTESELSDRNNATHLHSQCENNKESLCINDKILPFLVAPSEDRLYVRLSLSTLLGYLL